MSIRYSTNSRGDKLETYGMGLVINLSYWECDCDENWVHPTDCYGCGVCEAHINDCASARDVDVQQQLGEMK
jgi:hypothetical protein